MCPSVSYLVSSYEEGLSDEYIIYIIYEYIIWVIMGTIFPIMVAE